MASSSVGRQDSRFLNTAENLTPKPRRLFGRVSLMGAVPAQQVLHRLIPKHFDEGRPAILLLGVHVRAVSQEQLDDPGVPRGRGEVERRPPIVVTDVDGGAVLEEQGRQVGATLEAARCSAVLPFLPRA
jgi:hypothetical protein